MLIFSSTQASEKNYLLGARFTEDSQFYPTLTLRTADGLNVGVDCVIFYSLGNNDESIGIGEQFSNLYSRFAGNYNEYLEKLVIFELGNIVTLHNGTDVILNQNTIANTFSAKLRQSMASNYFTLVSAAISDISFQNTSYIQALEGNSMVKQNISALNIELQTTQLLANLSIQNAELVATMTKTLAVSKADIEYLYQMAIVNSTEYTFAKKELAFLQAAYNLELDDDFRFSRAEKLLTLYWIALELLNYTTSDLTYVSAMKTYQLNQFGSG